MAIKEAVAGGLAGGTQLARGIAKMLTPGKVRMAARPQGITIRRGGSKSKVGAPVNKTGAGGGAGG